MSGNHSQRGLSLVIPAYNEAAVIAAAVEEAETALGQLFDHFEILVVDDGSSDGTAAIVEEMSHAAPHTRILRHDYNRGYGAALRTGFEAASFDFAAFTDADCQFDLLDLGQLMPLAKDFAIVAGYRLDRKDTWRRRFFSKGYNLIARTILGTRVRDCDCALKVFRREAVVRILPESRGFFANAEMLTRARQLDLPIVEVAVSHRPRKGGASKVSLWEIPRTLGVLLSFWWREVATGPRQRLEAGVVVQARVEVGGRTLPAATPSVVPPPVAARVPSLVPVRLAELPERRRGAA